MPYDDPAQPTLDVQRVNSTTLSVSSSPVNGFGSAPSYAVLLSANGATASQHCQGLTAPNCALVTEPGVTYTIWVEATNQTGRAVQSDKKTVLQYSPPQIDSLTAQWDGLARPYGDGRALVSFSASASPPALDYQISLAGSTQLAGQAGQVAFTGLLGGLDLRVELTVCHRTVPKGLPDRCLQQSVPVQVKTKLPTFLFTTEVRGPTSGSGPNQVGLVPSQSDLAGWDGFDYRWQIVGQPDWIDSPDQTAPTDLDSGLVVLEVWPLGQEPGDWSTQTFGPFG
jgi:hypothetical protein